VAVVAVLALAMRQEQHLTVVVMVAEVLRPLKQEPLIVVAGVAAVVGLVRLVKQVRQAAPAS
jgi:hypothetical protein